MGDFRITELTARVEFYVSDTNSSHVVKIKANQQMMQDLDCGLQREKKTHNKSRMTALQVVMSRLGPGTKFRDFRIRAVYE